MGGERESEAAHWAAARGGDAQAFTALFELHRDRVFRCAARLVQTSADADDVTSVVFLELWRRRDAVVLVDDSVLPWLCVTAANVARNVRRGTARYRRLLDHLPRTPEAVDHAEAVLDRLGAARSPLGLALQRLRPVDVALLTLTTFEGYSVTEAAAAVGLTHAAARSRLSRVRAHLRLELGGDREGRTGRA